VKFSQICVKRTMQKTILAVIPARGGTKGIPYKNIKGLGDKPLIQYIFDAARCSKYIDQLVLSTDDEGIAVVAKELGIEVPFMRPEELARDDSSLISVIKHAMRYFDDLGIKVDGVLSLQPTCPFLNTRTIDKAVELWLNSGCDSVTTVSEITKGHPYISKRLKENGRIEDFCVIPEGADNRQRQYREKAYYLTGGLYLRNRSLVESDKSGSHHLGEDSRSIIINEIESLDINTDFDFSMAEFVLERGLIKF
jgi:CMP-N,N'-diacetyllegionaminic acid synthase